MTEPAHRRLGMTDDEYAAVIAILEREPEPAELAMYSVMWSEHCSYKSSRAWLGRFPTEAPWVVVGPGENAGVVDLGDGWLAALRIEDARLRIKVDRTMGLVPLKVKISANLRGDQRDAALALRPRRVFEGEARHRRGSRGGQDVRVNGPVSHAG